MQFCDNNPAILQWASESINVPYRNPFTGKNTIYVPDFLITYQDANGSQHAEVVEVKPSNHTFREAVGKSAYNQQQMEKFDVRNKLFKDSGLMTALFPRVKA